MAKKLNPIDPALEIRILKESVSELKAEIKNISNWSSENYIKIEERFESFQFGLNKRKNKLTEPQQILVFYHLGFMEPIMQLPIQEQHKARIISDLLKTGFENTKKYIRKIGTKDSPTYTLDNYEVLEDYFDTLGLKKERIKCVEILGKIRSSKKY